MKNQRDKLHQYQKRIQILTTRERDLAKEALARNDKPRALLALRRKKYQESLLAKTDGQLMQLEMLAGDVEFALVQKDVLYGLQQGTAVLKEIRREMGGIEGVEKLVGEGEEEKRYQEEIGELLQGKLSNDEEDEVEEELERLRASTGRTAEALPGVPASAVDAPSVPAQGVPSREDTEPARDRSQLLAA